MNPNQEIFESLVEILPSYPFLHAPTEPWYLWVSQVATKEAARIFSREKTETNFSSGPLEGLQFPFHKMGGITSLHLFGVDELILFSYYWASRHRYRRVFDLGGNIGLHSIVFDRCGYETTTFEPDPVNYKVLLRNLELNKTKKVRHIPAAIAAENGKMTFTRLLGNLTGSHLKGSKAHVYGEVEEFEVETVAFRSILRDADFVKMDIEGQEANVILATTRDDWKSCEVMMEIGSVENAQKIYQHLMSQNLNAFSQKMGWSKVKDLADLPTSYKEGSVFVTAAEKMLWN